MRQLKHFVAVAEELHFGRAAQRLCMTQPPLSQSISALEEELEARLFQRTSRVVSLTPAGEGFLLEARAVLKRLAEAASTARRVHQGEAGPLTVGYMNPVMDAVLCRALAAFRNERPDVQLRLKELPSTEQLVELRAGRLDIAFVRAVGATADASDLLGLESLVVALEPYVLALPAGHPLASLRQVPLASAGRYPLILFPRASLPQLHDAVLGAFRASGVEPVVGQEVQGKHASLALVAAGLGLCLVPASARDWCRTGVVLRPIQPTPGAVLPVVEMRAVWRAGHAPASALVLAGLAAL